MKRPILTFAAAGMLSAGSALADADHVVLVHGMLMDGSAWKPVYEQLVAQGVDVHVAQLPLTGVEDDLAATKRLLDSLPGTSVLVGHSYGGLLVTELGARRSVRGLVYVAGFAPAPGESLGALNAQYPAALAADASVASADGFVTLRPDPFIADVATGLPETQARFLAASQVATSGSVFGYEVRSAGWQERPSHAIVATRDRTVSPELERFMYDRAGSRVTEIEAGHLVLLSHPEEVAEVILSAVRDAD
ncbi:alpha/beta hydrolase [Primorskyibacter flagellatus]|uniref:Alpha/beta hydrolase n=1 Tax=Primorskyibacter flagellatus TaxID=1387277 RepID=A0A917A1T3_9RHOB|nr:alpha/beta hydrolase [Primorskyibacter flagellatus]GGE21385.1 alpha/beta hydrolase [Primorskyibacter flagellatus]